MQGTSRGGADIKEIVRRLSLWGVNMLFVGGRTLLPVPPRTPPARLAYEPQYMVEQVSDRYGVLGFGQHNEGRSPARAVEVL